MKWNDNTPKMSVDPESYEVRADGELADVGPAEKLPLSTVYNLF
jgi:urease